MKKMLFLIAISLLLSGCSADKDEIHNLEERNAELEEKLIILEELKLKNKKLEEKLALAENIHKKEIETIIEKNKVIEKELLQRGEYEKRGVLNYFESSQYIDTRNISELENEKFISVNGIKLFMTKDEVKSIYGEEYVEEIFYEYASGYLYVYWTYEDGTIFEFNPTYLVAMKFNSEEIETELGIKINSNALKSLSVLDKKFIRYSNIHKQDNSEDIFGYYYDERTDTNIHVFIDNGFWNYESVSNESLITGIKIIADEWEFYN